MNPKLRSQLFEDNEARIFRQKLAQYENGTPDELKAAKASLIRTISNQDSFREQFANLLRGDYGHGDMREAEKIIKSGGVYHELFILFGQVAHMTDKIKAHFVWVNLSLTERGELETIMSEEIEKKKQRDNEK